MDVSSDQLSQLIQNLAAKRGVKDSLGKPLRPWPVIATVGASGSGKSTFNNTLYEAALALEEEVDTEVRWRGAAPPSCACLSSKGSAALVSGHRGMLLPPVAFHATDTCPLGLARPRCALRTGHAPRPSPQEQPARPRQLAADSAALDELPFDDSLLLGVRPLPPARLQFFMLAEGDVGHTTQVQGRVMPLPDGGACVRVGVRVLVAAVGC